MERKELFFWEGIDILMHRMAAEGRLYQERTEKNNSLTFKEYDKLSKSKWRLIKKIFAFNNLFLGKKGIRKREISCLVEILQAKTPDALSDYLHQWTASDVRLARDVARCLTGNSRDAGVETKVIMQFLSERCQTRTSFDRQEIHDVVRKEGSAKKRKRTRKAKTAATSHFKVITFLSHPKKGFNMIVQHEAGTQAVKSFSFTKKGLDCLKNHPDAAG